MFSSNETHTPILLQKVDAILSGIAAIVGSLSLILLTGLIVVDVFLRYVFNSPIFGAQDIATMALIMIVAISIPYAARTGMHVFVEVLDRWLGRMGSRIADIVVRLIGFVVVSQLSLKLWLGMGEVVEFGEATQLLGISFAPFYLALSLAFGFYAFILLIEALVLFTRPIIPKLVTESYKRQESGNE